MRVENNPFVLYCTGQLVRTPLAGVETVERFFFEKRYGVFGFDFAPLLTLCSLYHLKASTDQHQPPPPVGLIADIVTTMEGVGDSIGQI